LGIPMNAAGLPPRSLVQNYFDYNDLVTTTSGSSAEAKLYRLDNPEWDAWGQENQGWKPIPEDTPIEALRITAKWRDMDKQYDALVDKQGKADEFQRDIFLGKNIDYATARIERDAWDKKMPAAMVPTYVEYYSRKAGLDRGDILISSPDEYIKLAQQFGDKTVNAALDSLKQGKEDKALSQEAVSILKEQLATDEKRANDLDVEAAQNLEDLMKNKEYAALVKANKEKREVMEYLQRPRGFTVGQHASAQWEDDWYLMEHKDFYTEMVKLELWQPRDFTKVPTREIGALYDQYSIIGTSGNGRVQFRLDHPDFDKWMLLAGKVSKLATPPKPPATKTKWPLATKAQPTTKEEANIKDITRILGGK
jgi:hypothetical protein